MNLLYTIDPALPYQERIARIRENRIALWDAIRSCRRQGSLDNAIRNVVLNDIPGFLEMHPEIRFIGVNGKTAGKYLVSGLRAGPVLPVIRVCLLPSTSPANTRYTIGEKLERWKTILEYTR
jgi:hypoxanthine-DNA glycosylase